MHTNVSLNGVGSNLIPNANADSDADTDANADADANSNANPNGIVVFERSQTTKYERCTWCSVTQLFTLLNGVCANKPLRMDQLRMVGRPQASLLVKMIL
jgi:hypothetical protein